jgi:hypothetical protein
MLILALWLDELSMNMSVDISTKCPLMTQSGHSHRGSKSSVTAFNIASNAACALVDIFYGIRGDNTSC